MDRHGLLPVGHSQNGAFGRRDAALSHTVRKRPGRARFRIPLPPWSIPFVHRYDARQRPEPQGRDKRATHHPPCGSDMSAPDFRTQQSDEGPDLMVIGVAIGHGDVAAVAVVHRLSRRYPRIAVHLAVGSDPDLYRKLRDRNLDLLIARKFGLIDERLEFESLFDDSPYLVAAGARSPWARRRRIELAELANESWVLPLPSGPIGSVAMEAFRASGLAYPRRTVFVDTAEGRINLLASGRFLTILARSTLRFSTGRPKFKVLPVELPSSPVLVGIVTLKNRTLSPVARLFIEHAREVAKRPAKKKG